MRLQRAASALIFASLAALASVAACTAFATDDPNPNPSITDGDGGGGGDALTGTDVQTADSGAGACVPAPIDASPPIPDPHCDGPNNLEVDLASSDTHCGRCNHSCLGAGCNNSRCKVREVDNVWKTGSRYVFAVRDEQVYVGDQTDLLRVDLTGAPYVSTLTVRDPDASAPAPPNLQSAVLDGETIVAVGQNKGIYSVPRTGGGLTLILGSSGPESLTSVGGDIYWVDYNHSRIERVGSAAPFWSVPTGAPTGETIAGVTSDDTRVYWSSRLLGDGGAELMGQLRMSVKGQAANPVIRAELSTSSQALLVFGGYLYWVNLKDHDVYRVSVDGTEIPVPIAHWVEPGSATDEVKGLTADDDRVYWAIGAYGAGQATNVYSAPKCGGRTTLIVSDSLWGHGLGALKNSLVWAHATGLAYVAK